MTMIALIELAFRLFASQKTLTLVRLLVNAKVRTLMTENKTRTHKVQFTSSLL